jgi:hypothetical protein
MVRFLQREASRCCLLTPLFLHPIVAPKFPAIKASLRLPVRSALTSVNFSAVGWVEKERSMKKIVFELLSDVVDQIFGVKPAKRGRLGITFYGLNRANEYGLTLKDLEEVFRYGEQINPEMQVRQYQNYSIGITYKYHAGDDRYMIITCWKRPNWTKKR